MTRHRKIFFKNYIFHFWAVHFSIVNELKDVILHPNTL